MDIPFIDAGDAGSVALVDALPDVTAGLVRTALGVHPMLPALAPIADAVSRRWLERNHNPYRGEIAAVAARLRRPGAYLLNCVYEWACSTSAGPDPAGEGSRMIRVLDWGMRGIGRYAVAGRHAAPAGAYLAATWPGYAGILTGMAPGRFSAAINQAPRQVLTRVQVANEVGLRLRMLRRGGLPAAHLLRRVFEQARDYEAALSMLMDRAVAVAMPALVTVSGVRPEEAAVVELMGRERALHRARHQDGWIAGAANDWLSPWPGAPRLHAHVRRPGETPASNNAERRRLICAVHPEAFAGASALPAPVLNAHTVLVVVANARLGTLVIEALDVAADRVPRIVAGPRTIAA